MENEAPEFGGSIAHPYPNEAIHQNSKPCCCNKNPREIGLGSETIVRMCDGPGPGLIFNIERLNTCKSTTEHLNLSRRGA